MTVFVVKFSCEHVLLERISFEILLTDIFFNKSGFEKMFQLGLGQILSNKIFSTNVELTIFLSKTFPVKFS